MWVSQMPAPYVRPRNLPPIVRGSPQRLLGAYCRSCDTTLGAVSTSGAIEGAAAGAKLGSVVPGVGNVVGGIVGAVVGGIFGKKKKRPDNSAAIAAHKQAFQDYLNIAGTVPGRAIGLERLRDIWKGAAQMGHFPKFAGHEEWIDNAIDGCKSCDANTFNILVKQALSGPARMAPISAPAGIPGTMAPAPTPQPVMSAPDIRTKLLRSLAGARLAGLNGLGDLGAIDAKTFVDRYFWPTNTSMGNQWAVSTDAVGQQIIYDVADAYLAATDPTTPAYVASAPAPTPQPSGPVTTVAAPSSSLPTQPTSTPTTTASVVPQQSTPAPSSTTVVPVPATAAGTPDLQALVQQLLAQGQSAPQAYQSALSSLDAAGIPPTADVQAATAQAVHAGVGGEGVPGWLLAVLAGGALVFALARPARSPRAMARERRA